MRRTDRSLLALLGALVLSAARPAYGCDPCALYSATAREGLNESSVALFLFEELTSYERRSQDRASIRDGERTETYSVTQIGASYGIGPRFSAQLTLPFIVREFEEYTSFRRRERTDSGIGDVILSGHYALLEENAPDAALRMIAYAGVKFPTGDTGSLDLLATGGEEEEHGAAALARHHTSGAGLGADALNFGTGSFDFPFGASAFARKGRAFLSGFAQYTLRTEGSFDYEFGDDIVFETSPGYFVWLSDDNALDARLIFSGESKADDERDGEKRRETDLTHLYLGAGLRYSGWKGISAGVSLELPVYRDQRTGVLPEYRVQASVAKRF